MKRFHERFCTDQGDARTECLSFGRAPKRLVVVSECLYFDRKLQKVTLITFIARRVVYVPLTAQHGMQ